MASPDLQAQRIGGLLIRQGLLSEQVAQHTSREATSEGRSFVQQVVYRGIVEGSILRDLLATAFSAPTLDLSTVKPAPPAKVAALMDPKLVRRLPIWPLSRQGKQLFIAVEDPGDYALFDDLKFSTGHTVIGIAVATDQLASIREGFLRLSSLSEFQASSTAEPQVEQADNLSGDADELSAASEEAPVVRFVQNLLADAITRGASDIHIESYPKQLRVRYRLDGVLQNIVEPPLNLRDGVISRLKVLAHLDISERRLPQDGRLRVRLGSKPVDFRISFLPTLHGEKVVMRLLDPAQAQVGIERLGLFPAQQEAFLESISRPYGLILVTGPTGSGKTVSLYTALNLLNTAERNISTAEDPVEITLPGVNQVQVNEKIGLDFTAALRAFLRQDPDVIMVGEIRDKETAEIAIKAAQTGHLVLSTLHTNDGPQTIGRLMNMGIPAYHIAASLNLILAQRLARRLCPDCRIPKSYPESVLAEAGFTEPAVAARATLYEAGHCPKCGQTGYKGRIGLYQAMPIDDLLRTAILNGATPSELATLSRQSGVLSLRQSALERVRDGTTSLAEALRVTNADSA